jgi:hypothetical protein
VRSNPRQAELFIPHSIRLRKSVNESQWMLLFLFAKEKVTKKKNRGLVIFYDWFVLGRGQWCPKIPEAAFRTIIKGLVHR